MWGDEAFIVASLYTRDLAGMLGPLEYRQIAPPGFMWAELGAARLLGFSERALRLVPLICGMGAMVLFGPLARRLLNRRAALISIALLAASYYPIRHGVEVKPYAGDLLMAVVVLRLGWWVHRRGDSLKRWAVLTATGAAALWVSFPAAFMVGAVGVFLGISALRRRSRRQLIACAAFVVATAASLSVLYVLAVRPQRAAFGSGTVRTWANAWPPLHQPWRLGLWLLDIHTGNLMAYPVGGKSGGSAATLILVVIGCAVLWRRGRRSTLGLLLLPVPLMLGTAATGLYPYGTSARVAQHLAPSICLLAGAGLAGALRYCLPGVHRLRGVYIAVGVLAGLVCAGIIMDIARPLKKFSDRANLQAMRSLATQTQPQDRWVIFNSLHEVPHAPLLSAVGGSGARFLYYVRRLAPVEVRWSPLAEDVAPPSAGRLWLIAYRDNKAAFPDDLLDEYVDILRRRLGEPAFHSQVLTSAKDPTRGYEERIDAYEFGP